MLYRLSYLLGAGSPEDAVFTVQMNRKEIFLCFAAQKAERIEHPLRWAGGTEASLRRVSEKREGASHKYPLNDSGKEALSPEFTATDLSVVCEACSSNHL